MVRSWKALGLVLVTAVGALLLAQSLSPGSGQAAASSVSFSSSSFTSGGSVTVTVVATDDDGSLTVAASGATNPVLSILSCVKTSPDTFDGSQNCPGSAVSNNATASVVVATANLDTDTTAEPLTVTFSLTATCTSNATITVSATQPGGNAQNTVGCTAAAATATPTVTGTPVQAVATVTVSVAPSTLNCGGSAFVTVVSKNSAGQVVAGGTVTLSTTLGTISPTTATDQGSGVLAVLTAPTTQGGTAIISAQVGSVSGQAQAIINCAQATATPIPPTAIPPTQVPQAIRAPGTGDAGLAAGSSEPAFAALALLAGSFAGAAALAWARMRH